VRDKERVFRAVSDINIIFHAAALKHVHLCEYNPLEAIKTNILGAQNVIEAALNTSSVERFINISTDKATNPIGTMGATKLLTEKLTTWANFYKKNGPVFASVRFGNVLASRGSVVPLFRDQIKAGGPVTVTDPDMRRFFMYKTQAINLILKAMELAKGGETFVLKMPVMKISDLVNVMIEKIAPKYGYNAKDIKIKHIGARAGERLNESLLNTEEVEYTKETNDMLIVLPTLQFLEYDIKKYIYPDEKKCLLKNYNTENADLLTKDEIYEQILKLL